MVDKWTADDLPDASVAIDRYGTIRSMYLPAVNGYRDAVVDRLNEHYPKPSGDRNAVVKEAIRQKRRAIEAERERDEWEEKYLDADKALHEARESADKWFGEWQKITPAHAVTREEVEACVYGSRRAGRECDGQGFVPVHVREAVEQLCHLFGIRAERTADPVEEKARELYGVANPGMSWDAVVRSAKQGNGVDGQVVREYRAIARHVLGQKASDE